MADASVPRPRRARRQRSHLDPGAGGAFLVIVGFAVGAWGAFKGTTWWEPVTIVSAVVGLIVLIMYWIGASGLAMPNFWTNLVLHAMGSVAVLAVLFVPPAHDWLLGRL